MDERSILETIAETGVTLAGFAGIIGALAGEKLRPANPVVWLPFWVMISSGLGIIFAALFPFLPIHLGAPDHVSWAVSSGFVTVITACNLVFFTPRFLRSQRDGILARRLVFEVLFYFSSFFLLISQVLNTFGVGLHQRAGGVLSAYP